MLVIVPKKNLSSKIEAACCFNRERNIISNQKYICIYLTL